MTRIGYHEELYRSTPLEQKFGWFVDAPGAGVVDASWLGALGNEYLDSDQQMRTTMQNLGAGWSGDGANAAAGALHRVAAMGQSSGYANVGGGATVDGYGQSFEVLRGKVQWQDPGAWGWQDTAALAFSAASLSPIPFLAQVTQDHYAAAQQNKTFDAAAVRALVAHENEARTAVDQFPAIAPAASSGAGTGGGIGGGTPVGLGSPAAVTAPAAVASAAGTGSTAGVDAPALARAVVPGSAPRRGAGSMAGPAATPAAGVPGGAGLPDGPVPPVPPAGTGSPYLPGRPGETGSPALRGGSTSPRPGPGAARTPPGPTPTTWVTDPWVAGGAAGGRASTGGAGSWREVVGGPATPARPHSGERFGRGVAPEPEPGRAARSAEPGTGYGAPMMGAGRGGPGGREHRRKYWIPSSDPFDVPLPPHTCGVISAEEDR